MFGNLEKTKIHKEYKMKTSYRLVIDSELWYKFKVACAEERISMVAKITQLIAEYLNQVFSTNKK